MKARSDPKRTLLRGVVGPDSSDPTEGTGLSKHRLHGSFQSFAKFPI